MFLAWKRFTSRLGSRSPWACLYWLPVRRANQMLFAEAFNQALEAGMEVSVAIRAAAVATPGWRFRAALREMALHYRSGYTLADSLARTGVAVGGELLAALSVGEEQGDLPASLAAFARRGCGHPGARLAAAIGRRSETTLFAAALGRLLRDRRLTVDLIEDAARLAAGDGSAFVAAVGWVTEDMRNGITFPLALTRQSRFFDPLFCALVGAPDGRDRLRAVLARLGETDDPQSSHSSDRGRL